MEQYIQFTNKPYSRKFREVKITDNDDFPLNLRYGITGPIWVRRKKEFGVYRFYSLLDEFASYKDVVSLVCRDVLPEVIPGIDEDPTDGFDAKITNYGAEFYKNNYIPNQKYAIVNDKDGEFICHLSAMKEGYIKKNYPTVITTRFRTRTKFIYLSRAMLAYDYDSDQSIKDAAIKVAAIVQYLKKNKFNVRIRVEE